MNDWRKDREKIIGLGEESFRKSYYPELQDKLRELESARLNMENILRSMADAVVIHDDQGRFKYMNQRALEMFNISQEEVIEHSIKDVTAPGMDLDEIPVFLERVKQDKNYTIEWAIMQRGSQKIYPLQVNMSLIEWDSQPSLISVLRDFSVRKRFERELITAKHKAEESDRLKSAFLANVSHEIRTPMNGILGFSNLLKDPDLTYDERLSYVEIIDKGGKRLLNIINQVMDISKIEAGTVRLNMHELDIEEKLNFYHSFYAPSAQSKGLIFNMRLDLTEPSWFYTDIEKFDAIFTNLIQNAIKYSESGTIEFGCVTEGDYLRFYVRDEGIGIAKDRQDAIFERFVQADLEDRDAYQGAGLGLAISKAYLNLLGGKFKLESSLGKGSEFSFKLPKSSRKINKATSASKKSEQGHRPKVNDLNILIVEDDETSEILLRTALKDYMSDVTVVRNGVKAVELIKQGNPFDLIFMDIRLPGINGFDASREIRKINSEIIIIAQTAHALSGDQEKALAAGCNDYLPKPINIRKMRTVLHKYFSNDTTD